MDLGQAQWLAEGHWYMLPFRFESNGAEILFYYDVTHCETMHGVLRSVVPGGQYVGILVAVLSVMEQCEEHRVPLSYVQWDPKSVYISAQGYPLFVVVPALGLEPDRNTATTLLQTLADARRTRLEDAVVHDVCYRARPDFYTDPRGRLSAAWHCLQYRRIAKRAERIITVSEFSKSEIAKYYGVPASKMDVVYNAWQQMQRIAPDEGIFARHPQLKPGQYYFSMANLLKNKNFPWVLRAAGAKPDAVFAIAGGGSLAAEAERLGLADLPNVLYLGYVSDGAAKALMAHCKAFLFPTLYEGFGIPPLEAAACGAPQIIVSDTPCMREVYGPCAAYIDLTANPGDVDDVTPATAPTAALLEKYSWDKSAERLLQILNK